MPVAASLGLCILAGLLWAGAGVAYNQAARRGIHPAAMLLAAAGCALLVILPWCRWQPGDGADPGQQAALIQWLAVSGLANWAGMMSLQTAMARGRAGLAWALGQSAPVVPFLVAILAHGERPELAAWGGVAAMLVAVASLARTGSQDHTEWRSTRWALAAFAFIGLQQSAMAEPSHRGLADPGQLRLPVFFLAMFLASALTCGLTRTPVRASAWLFGAGAAVASLSGQWLLLRSLDQLAQQNRAGLAYPTAVGTSILVFALWRAADGERYGPARWAALAVLVVGLLLLALGTP